MIDMTARTPAALVNRADQSTTPEISLVVTVTERPEPLAELVEEYTRPLAADGRSYEVIVMAHPHFEQITADLRDRDRQGKSLRVVEVGRSIGETALLRAALPLCRGRVILTAPAYRQVEPSAVAALMHEIDRGSDMAVARRFPRRDPWVNRAQHRVLNSLIGNLSGDRIHDVGCGVRAIRRDALGEIPLYGDVGRFLPILALHHGFSVTEVPVPQHANDVSRRVYGPGTYVRRLVDVLGLFFLLRFTFKPLRFFGLVGAGLAAVGAVILAVMFVQRLGGEGVADRPLLLLGVLLVTLGMQAIALGLIGEMIVHFNAPRQRQYRLKEEG